MQDVLVVAIVFAVPISAIWAWARVRMRRMELEAGVGSRDLTERLAKLERDNADLRERVGTLESIVTLDEQPRTRVRVDASTAARELDEVERGEVAADRRAAR